MFFGFAARSTDHSSLVGWLVRRFPVQVLRACPAFQPGRQMGHGNQKGPRNSLACCRVYVLLNSWQCQYVFASTHFGKSTGSGNPDGITWTRPPQPSGLKALEDPPPFALFSAALAMTDSKVVRIPTVEMMEEEKTGASLRLSAMCLLSTCCFWIPIMLLSCPKAGLVTL